MLDLQSKTNLGDCVCTPKKKGKSGIRTVDETHIPCPFIKEQHNRYRESGRAYATDYKINLNIYNLCRMTEYQL